ncbi:uncharacterized protein LOC133531027 [Cydia pomonella]|uniref:uncharacterized protein LOC133531027 n=1 Tax=Cydia pomonella TaxID=82600 RepID=UPI002ADD3AB9|nr:uncharacterized protein LOC133531027 [Cydia pomonella]
MPCLFCNGPINDSTFLKCIGCAGSYHCSCLDITLAQCTENFLQTWLCSFCTSVNTRRRRNDNTPIQLRPGISTFDDSVMSCDDTVDNSKETTDIQCTNLSANSTLLATPPNSYQLRQVQQESNTLMPQELLNNILSKVTALQTQFSAIQVIQMDISQVKSDIAEMKSSIDIKLDDLAGRMTTIESRVSALEESKTELDGVKKVIDDIINDSRKNEQWVRRSNIQINGVPEVKGENLYAVLKSLAEVSGFPLDTNTDIDFVTRVAVRNDRDNAKPKPIIVKMQARYKKDDFMSSLRKIKNLKAADLGYSNSANRVYINDHLSSFNKHLLKEAKQRAIKKQYKFCWVRNCTVMVRRNENSPILYITSEDSLNKIT